MINATDVAGVTGSPGATTPPPVPLPEVPPAGSQRDALALRNALPSGTVVLTSRCHATPGGRISIDVYGVGGAHLDAQSVALVTGLRYDARRKAVMVWPGDVAEGMTAAETVVGRLVWALGDGDPDYRLGHRRAVLISYSRTGRRATADWN